MPLDPQAEVLLKALAQMPAFDYATVTAPAMRQFAQASRGTFGPGDPVAAIEHRSIPGPAGPIRVRLYYPERAPNLPVTLFFHGGGFVICDLDSHDNICRCLAVRGRTLVISVDYRRAPEAPFPAAVDDALAALAWARDHAQEVGGDPGRIAVAGDSAGGNLAAVVAQQVRGALPSLRHQLLYYPVMDCRCESPTYRSFGEGYYLTTDMMQWFVRQYLNGCDPGDVRASPLRQRDLGDLPSTTIITAEFDPLRDEGEAYADVLRKAGVTVNLLRWPGQIHGFASMLGVISAADAALTAGGEMLGAALAVR